MLNCVTYYEELYNCDERQPWVDELLDAEAAAKFMDFAPKTLANWLSLGFPVLPYEKKGGKTFYWLSEIEKFLNAHCIAGGLEYGPVIGRKKTAKHMGISAGTLAVRHSRNKFYLKPIIIGMQTIRYRISVLDREQALAMMP